MATIFPADWKRFRWRILTWRIFRYLLITAFENQLDKLFQSDALDVTTDIAALEGMLNMDGLTDSAFGK